MKQHVAVIGTQWGDEGKGKIVDALVPDFDVVVRYQGGPNAGHTVVADGETYKLHLLPSGILYPDKTCLIADGVIVDPLVLVEELTRLQETSVKQGRLLMGSRVNLIMPWHRLRDGIAGGKVGTSKRGIGPTYTDMVNRRGIRVHEWLDEAVFRNRVSEETKWNRLLVEAMAKEYGLKAKDIEAATSDESFNADGVSQSYLEALEVLREFGLEFVDCPIFLDDASHKDMRFLFEGAQGSMLDVVYGNYPFVTSSHVTPGGIVSGTGFMPKELTVIGVMKAYTTRVGNGPFPTELEDDFGVLLQNKGNEFGATTGRPRRCGWLDLEVVKHAIRINGIDSLVMTKLDILSGMEHLDVGIGYFIDSQEQHAVPASTLDHDLCVPVYEKLSGWKEEIADVKDFNELPNEAQAYVQYVQDFLQVPVIYVGVGPERESLLKV